MKQWLIDEFKSTTRLIILEGFTGSGKTTLTREPFDLGTTPSKNIELVTCRLRVYEHGRELSTDCL